eukprot:g3218.t1
MEKAEGLVRVSVASVARPGTVATAATASGSSSSPSSAAASNTATAAAAAAASPYGQPFKGRAALKQQGADTRGLNRRENGEGEETVRRFLESLHMAEVYDRLVHYGITSLRLVSTITAETMEEMGVPLGFREGLSWAINRLRQRRQLTLGASSSPLSVNPDMAMDIVRLTASRSQQRRAKEREERNTKELAKELAGDEANHNKNNGAAAEPQQQPQTSGRGSGASGSRGQGAKRGANDPGAGGGAGAEVSGNSLERQQHQLRGTPAAAEHGAEHGAADNENDGAWSASNDGERGGGNFGDEET